MQFPQGLGLEARSVRTPVHGEAHSWLCMAIREGGVKNQRSALASELLMQLYEGASSIPDILSGTGIPGEF